jgi:undecaprenyl diphosphate synthase
MSAVAQPHRTDLTDLKVDAKLLDSYQGKVPRHVAIIMDGNGRWAQQRGMRRIRGHHQGAHAVRHAVEACRYLGVETLTLYAFSEQNWGRPQDEVSGLLTLFDIYIKRERKRLIKNQVGLKVIGDVARLPDKLRAAIRELEEATAPGAKMTLQVAVSYGGREEILLATRAIAEQIASGELRSDQITEELFSSYLYTASQPDLDLMIRTSGEMRISNFLLWQVAYAEIFVTDTLWPDFDESSLVEAFGSFDERERRFGMTGEQLTKVTPEPSEEH